ncbi:MULTISPECIES: hypothetical protein [Candidatus Ichthyocystis]|uniref:hypothetical protein n=1 Tax=Candidatus Ichthyocystis TaxID=2929841 RepID=UPI000B885D5A|nr:MULTISPECIES: hypothetical protein [Ichthyocystis]
MSGRVTRDTSGSSSDSETSGGPADVAGGHSPLGAVGQDRDVRSSGSGGGGRSSRGSLTSPGHTEESRGLGAKPRKKTEGKEGKGGKHHTRKGIEWNKKDRRAAKVHRGEGQRLAAERAARAAAEEAAMAAKDAAEGRGGNKKDDGLGLIVLRTKGPRTRHHGHGHHRKNEPKHGDTDHHMSGIDRLCLLLGTAVAVGGSLATLVSLLSSILSSDTAGPPVNGTREGASAASGSVWKDYHDNVDLAFMVMHLFLSMLVLAVWCAYKFSDRGKKRKK